ncbi:MAG TPA: type II toxin-antitoxin system VapC family toxin [Thermoanaerobaculia bacterium]|nr:type II toxin-antitoxin system VapC family toxin [Thermoanaerobaculia bacterium]
MIVVDANVLIYLWLKESYADTAAALLSSDPHWIAPLLWRSEFRNVIVGALRRKIISRETALAVMDGAEHQMDGNERLVDSRDVLRLAAVSRCSAYDCEYVALAEAAGVPLITNDAQVLKEFPSIARPFAAKPN